MRWRSLTPIKGVVKPQRGAPWLPATIAEGANVRSAALTRR